MTTRPVFCAICLTVRQMNEEWFLLVENCWTDRVKILSWHDELAFSPATHAVCCVAHVQLLVIHWMTTGTLQYPFARSEAWADTSRRPDSIPASSMRDESDLTGTKVLAELAVHRESIDRILVESPTSLAALIVALKDALPGQVDRSEVTEPEACGEYVLSEA